MQDRPRPDELARAVQDFLRDEISPRIADPRLRFRLLVAINGLGMIDRELCEAEPLMREELATLASMLDRDPPVCGSPGALREALISLNTELARRIRAGNAPSGTARALRAIADAKLRIVNPRALRRYARAGRPSAGTPATRPPHNPKGGQPE